MLTGDDILLAIGLYCGISNILCSVYLLWTRIIKPTFDAPGENRRILYFYVILSFVVGVFCVRAYHIFPRLPELYYLNYSAIV
jgi:uncharacterized membrane protein YoaK (UPF0700 family)